MDSLVASTHSLCFRQRAYPLSKPYQRTKNLSNSSYPTRLLKRDRAATSRCSHLYLFSVQTRLNSDNETAGNEVIDITNSTQGNVKENERESISIESGGGDQETEGRSFLQIGRTETESLPVVADSGGESEGKVTNESSESSSLSTIVGGSLLAAVVLLGLVSVAGGNVDAIKGEIYEKVQYFEGILQTTGPSGYILFIIGYAVLEMLAIPAIPITMSAGLLFGVFTGTILVSISGTLAATGAFLIARYAVRDRVLSLVRSNKKFVAIDRAIGEDSFRVVLLLRLSPLLPFSLGNYVYGITSVKIVPYIAASWLGMLPGTWAYVSAGSLGRTLISNGEGENLAGDSQVWTLGLGIVFGLAAASYITSIVKDAIKDLD